MGNYFRRDSGYENEGYEYQAQEGGSPLQIKQPVQKAKYTFPKR